ncbi:MAG: hypothetical protein JWQ99_2834 [Blastococcus sp.]|nr:hypothetical protein [Blastococcus sp.]
MTVVVPDRLPLELPPGNADALSELVRDVAGAAFHLTVLRGALAGPAACAAGWLGEDAVAATTQTAAVATLVGNAEAAVMTAMRRLSAHADRLHEARRQVAAWEREQEEDFAAAWGRLSRIEDLQAAQMTNAPELVSVVEELLGAEDSRRRRHAALLADVADDAEATACVLADCCGAVGGSGAPGDGGRVVTYLAARLPGWGDVELAGRGRALSEALLGDAMRPAERQALAESALVLAREPAFSTALVAGLGAEGVAALLAALSYDEVGARSAVARVLAAALGSATVTEDRDDPVRRVLTATYVHPGEDGPSEDIASGMAAVLAAVTPGRPGGLRLDTVADWGRQLLRRERAQGVVPGAGAVPRAADASAVDPVRLVVEALAAGGATGPAVALLGDRAAWDTLLARRWGDGGVVLAEVIRLGVTAPAQAGVVVVRAGLEALGTGLTDDGDPENWTVNKETAAAVSGALATGIAAHVSVATEVLVGADEDRRDEGSRDVLRGLAYLTLDRPAAVAVGQALGDWATARPLALDASSPAAPLPALAVPAGYLAVQEYAQRLAHSLRAFELEDVAEDRRLVWQGFSFVPTEFFGKAGDVLGVLDVVASRLLGTDGSWEIGADRGLRFDREDAADAALDRVVGPAGHAPAEVVDEIARQSRAAFDRVARALGKPEEPIPPDASLGEAIKDAVSGQALSRPRHGGGVP